MSSARENVVIFGSAYSRCRQPGLAGGGGRDHRQHQLPGLPAMGPQEQAVLLAAATRTLPFLIRGFC